MKAAFAALLAAGALVAVAPSASAATLSAAAAKQAAIRILIGDPYGQTPAAVARVIKGQALGADTHCGGSRQSWTFTVVVPPSATRPDGIDGYLVLDSRSGKLICAGLPFLD